MSRNAKYCIEKDVNFAGSWFYRFIRFVDISFQSAVTFLDFHLECRLIMVNISFNERVNFDTPYMTGKIELRSVVFDSNKVIKMPNLNEKILFLNTDSSRIKFDKIKTNKEFKLFDNEMLKIMTSPLFSLTKLDNSIENVDNLKKFLVKESYVPSSVVDFNLRINGSVIEMKNTNGETIGAIEFSGDSVYIDIDGFKEVAFRKTDDLERMIFYAYPDIDLDDLVQNYRNLRENCDYHFRYDESGKFFINEMDLKRNYSEKHGRITNNNILKKYLSPLGLYYLLSKYGEDLWRPFGIGVFIIGLSTFYWSFNFTYDNGEIISLTLPSTFDVYQWIHNGTNWSESFDRSLLDSLPLVSLENDQSRLLDYLTKLSFSIVPVGLSAIALRRKFERRFRH